MWWWVISPFNNFWGFWSVAVNTMDKLQFLVLIYRIDCRHCEDTMLASTPITPTAGVLTSVRLLYTRRPEYKMPTAYVRQPLQFWFTQLFEWHLLRRLHWLSRCSPHSFIPRLKPPFSAHPSHRSLPLFFFHGFPGLLTDLESIPHAPTRTMIILTKFEVDMTIHCRVTAFLSGWHVTWPGDLDLWPFDLEQLSYMAGHVINPATKFEDPTTILSWLTNYNGSHWLALKMRTRPLRMRRITWPVSRGWKTVTFLESPTPICLFTIQLRWLYDEYY